MPTQYSSKVSRSSERGLDSPEKANGHKEMWFGVSDRMLEQNTDFNEKQQQQQKNLIKKATVDRNL